MKVRYLTLMPVAALVGVAAAVAVPARAEASELRANVPFSFIVSGRTMPPGTYTLSERRGVLVVQGATTRVIVLVGRVESGERVGPSLVFHRYGDQYLLRQAWMGGSAGRELPEQSIERALAAAARKARTAGGVERVVIRAL
jgi:hypothetical protein